eukprot:31273-Pelagococcus_subviridis.AAC.1
MNAEDEKKTDVAARVTRRVSIQRNDTTTTYRAREVRRARDDDDDDDDDSAIGGVCVSIRDLKQSISPPATPSSRSRPAASSSPPPPADSTPRASSRDT